MSKRRSPIAKNQQEENRLFGKSWEEIFETRARSNGLWAIHNGLTARFIGPGQIKAVKSDLDYRLVMRTTSIGACAWMDCKTFDSEYMDYSMLTEHQVERALDYLHWGIPSGFIVWLRKAPVERQVVFFSAACIQRFGPGTRFFAEHGMCLGSIASFDLRAIFEGLKAGKPGSRLAGFEDLFQYG